METKKDIGAAVKNRLDHFKDSPDDLVWTHIEAKLKKKKKKRAFIFWMSGIGLVVLTLMLWIINPYDNLNENNTTKPEFNTVNINQPDIQKDSPANSVTATSGQTDSAIDERPNNNIITSNPLNTNEEKINQNTKSTSVISTSTTANSRKANNLQTTQNTNSNTSESDNTAILSDTSKKSLDEKSTLEHRINEDVTISEEKNTNKSTQLSDREKAILRRDSLITANKKKRDSLKLEQNSKLVSEEKLNDSIELDDQSRWTIMPQATLSYYGALNTKTTDNFSFNYGLLASYKMTKETYIRIGIRKLELNQTIDIDGTERLVEYLEFPLEIKYTPKQHKVNPFIIGGLSYFKLDKNSNNNALNFEYKATMSLNLGLGLETKIIKDIYFNTEAVFNYQIKPFSRKNSVEPFIFSVHTGLEYRF